MPIEPSENAERPRAARVADLLYELCESAEYVEVSGETSRRLVFRDKRAFKIFGGSVLNPFDDYTYEWSLHLLESIAEYLSDNPEAADLAGFKERRLYETVDSLVDVYTSELTRWLGDRPTNLCHLDDVLQEYGSTDSFQALARAQYSAIEEVAYGLCDRVEGLLAGNPDERT